jgi:cell division protein ZapA
MDSDKNVLKVRIYGAEYSIRGHADVNYMTAISEYVDQKMREVDSNIRVDSSLKVAILAAINITHELFVERVENERMRQQLEDKIKELSAMIDQKLSESSRT